MPARDVTIPIVFPDYLITVADRPRRIDVPDFLPGIPDEVTVPNRMPYLGHAGILFFNGRWGLAKYYEYGRYDPPANRGKVRRQPIPDVQMLRDGRPAAASLKRTLRVIAAQSGQGGRILGAYVELSEGAFDRMLARATGREHDNSRPNRAPYDLVSNSCLHFMKEVAESGGARMPWAIDPRPAGYIRDVRALHPDLDFKPPAALRVQGITLS